MARTVKKEKALTPGEKLAQALVPDVEQPYRVPDNWCWTYLGLISDIIMGQSPDGTATTDDPSFMPLVGGAADMGDLYPKATRYTKVPTKVSKTDDIILCIRATLGRPIYSDREYCLGRGVAAIRSDTNVKEFIRLGLVCFEQYLYDNATGTTFAQVSSPILKKMPFPLAPLYEQQRIVDRIESLFAKLDEAKEKAQAVVDGFEDRKAAILHKAFTGELTEEWRRDNSISKGSWKLVGFDDCVVAMQNGIAKRKGFTGEPYVVLRLANLSDDGFDETDLREIVLDEKEQKNYELHSDDVLMVRVNGSKDNVGKQYLITNQKRWAFCDHIIRIKYVNSIVPQYMVYFSKSEVYRQYIKDNMVSSAGQNTISRKGMARLQIPMPQKDEQEQIVSILSNLFEKEQQAKEAAEQVIDQIDTIKKSILARAFRGELGTNDPADESAVELLKRVL